MEPTAERPAGPIIRYEEELRLRDVREERNFYRSLALSGISVLLAAASILWSVVTYRQGIRREERNEHSRQQALLDAAAFDVKETEVQCLAFLNDPKYIQNIESPAWTEPTERLNDLLRSGIVDEPGAYGQLLLLSRKIGQINIRARLLADPVIGLMPEKQRTAFVRGNLVWLAGECRDALAQKTRALELAGQAVRKKDLVLREPELTP